jgi:hypothetical protein
MGYNFFFSALATVIICSMVFFEGGAFYFLAMHWQAIEIDISNTIYTDLGVDLSRQSPLHAPARD